IADAPLRHRVSCASCFVFQPWPRLIAPRAFLAVPDSAHPLAPVSQVTSAKWRSGADEKKIVASARGRRLPVRGRRRARGRGEWASACPQQNFVDACQQLARLFDQSAGSRSEPPRLIARPYGSLDRVAKAAQGRRCIINVALSRVHRAAPLRKAGARLVSQPPAPRGGPQPVMPQYAPSGSKSLRNFFTAGGTN